MRTLSIAVAVAVVALLMPLTLRGCELVMPTPPNQNAAQTAHCFGFIVSHACNQTIYQNQPENRIPEMLNNLSVLLVVGAIFILVLLVVGWLMVRWLRGGLKQGAQ